MTEFEKPQRHRIEYFDLLKGIAIFLVVMGHVITMCIRGLDAAFIFKLIEQVHMPIFFFISGYFTYKASAERTFITPGLKKRFLQLVVPFLVITPMWVCYFPHSKLLSPLSDNLPDLYRSVWKDGYWFTLCLFEMCALYMPLSLMLQRIKSVVGKVAMLMAAYGVLISLMVCFADVPGNVDYAGLSLLARFFPAFAIGVMAHHLHQGYQALLHRSGTFAVALVVFAGTFYCVAYPWDVWGADSAELWAFISLAITPVMHFSLFIIAITLVMPWSEKEFGPEAKPSVVARYFRLLGNESLGIYLLHYFFLFPLTGLQDPLKEMGLAFVPLTVTAASVAFCIIGVTLLVVYALKRNKITALLLLGTWK